VRHEAQLVAGNLALDFVNTASGRSVSWPTVYQLEDPFAILGWLRSSGAIDEALFRNGTRLAATDEQAAAAFLSSALRLRCALAATFGNLLSGVQPQETDLSVLSAVLAAAHGAERLVWTPDGIRIARIAPGGQTLEDALWPVALAAGKLLTAGEIKRLKKCASSTCDWLFIDTSKNGTRSWCQMSVCGNREKGRRRLRRERESGS
jgi:predicted RNA-binding Zn ribbon-like protein